MKKMIMTFAMFCAVCVANAREVVYDCRANEEGSAAVRADASLSDAWAGDRSAMTAETLSCGDVVVFQVADDRALTLNLKTVRETAAGRMFSASVGSGEGVLTSVLLQRSDLLVANIRDLSAAQVWTIEVSPSAFKVRRQVVSAVRNIGCCAQEEHDHDSESACEGETRAVPRLALAAAPAATAEPCVVDMLIVVDRGAAIFCANQGWAVSQQAEIAVEKMNLALANTGIDSYFRFRLKGVMLFDGVIGTDVTAAVLKSIVKGETVNGTDLKAIHERRDAIGADLVSVWIDAPTSAAAGLAYTYAKNVTDAYGYSLCDVLCAVYGDTMTHEVGHNLGAGHSTAQSYSRGPGYRNYSSGAYFSAAGVKYCTIMAYSNDGPGGWQIPYFSSPNYTYNGVATGDATHDNTRTLIECGSLVAAYRDGGDVNPADCRVDGVIFSPAPGKFTGSTTVSLASTEDGGVVHYTLDGSAPTLESPVWSGEPLTLTRTTLIRAVSETAGVTGTVYEAQYYTGTMMMTAKPKSCEVRFDAAGGICSVTNLMVSSGAAVGALPVPVRANYKFEGWYTGSEGGTLVADTTKVTATVTYYAHWKFSGKVLLNAVSNSSFGSVTGSGKSYAAGAKASLKATPAKGYVFAGWYEDAAFETPVASLDEYRNPAYACVMSTNDVTVYAKFITTGADVASVSFEMQDEYVTGVDSIAVPIDVSGCSSLPTVKVTGLPSGLKFTAKALIVKATKTAAEARYEANTLYGVATKSGVYTVVATVTTAGKKTASFSKVVVVRKAGEQVVKAEVPEIGGVVPGKVTGSGVYADGKKVTLKATANKGYVFSGWYDGDDLISRDASWTFVMGADDRELVARFITAAEDASAVSLAVDGVAMSAESAFETNLTCGVAVNWPVAADGLSTVTVKASGLPSGLKLVQDKTTKAWSVAGIPTAASKTDKSGVLQPSAVKFTVTTAGKNARTFTMKVYVAALPSWAVGTFNGVMRQVDRDAEGEVVVDEEGRHDWCDIVATVTVAANGKVSGKVQFPEGGSASFAFASLTEKSDDTFLVRGVVTVLGVKLNAVLQIGGRVPFAGSEVRIGEMDVMMTELQRENGTTISTDVDAPLIESIWSDKSLPKPPTVNGVDQCVSVMDGEYLCGLKFGKDGKITTSLYAADDPKRALKTGSATLAVLGAVDGEWHCEVVANFVITKGTVGLTFVIDVVIADDGTVTCAWREPTEAK